MLAAQSVLAAAPSYATSPPTHTSPARMFGTSALAPTPSPTPSKCNPKVMHCSKVIKASAQGTGEYSQGKTSVSNCNGRTYVGWTGSDDHLNAAWGSTRGSFPNKATFTDTAYYDRSQNPSIYTSPALVCWTPLSGPYVNDSGLWVIFTGTNKQLYYGFYNGQSTGYGVPLAVHKEIPDQSSIYSPAAIVSIGGTLWVIWRGNTTNYLYVEETPDGVNWYNGQDWHVNANGGPGFDLYCDPGLPRCMGWIAYMNTANQHLDIAYLDVDGNQQFYPLGELADFSVKNDDLTLTDYGSTLYLPYSGTGTLPYPNVDVYDGIKETWTNQQEVNLYSVFGVGGTVLSGGHLYIWFTHYPDNQIYVQQWN